MDEILLTHDEQCDAIDIALARCTRDRGLSPVHTVANEVCRAQVLKVYGYMRTHWLQARQLDYVTARDNTVLLTIRSEDWQALREAAGEGKDA